MFLFHQKVVKYQNWARVLPVQLFGSEWNSKLGAEEHGCQKLKKIAEDKGAEPLNIESAPPRTLSSCTLCSLLVLELPDHLTLSARVLHSLLNLCSPLSACVLHSHMYILMPVSHYSKT